MFKNVKKKYLARCCVCERNKSIQRNKKYQIYRADNNLVQFSVDFVWAKLFKKGFEVQSINGYNLCASSLPFVSERNKHIMV